MRQLHINEFYHFLLDDWTELYFFYSDCLAFSVVMICIQIYNCHFSYKRQHVCVLSALILLNPIDIRQIVDGVE